MSFVNTVPPEEAVQQRYSAGAQHPESNLCCPVNYDSRLLEAIPQEAIERATLFAVHSNPLAGGLHDAGDFVTDRIGESNVSDDSFPEESRSARLSAIVELVQNEKTQAACALL
jgi:hypothetical protein